MPVTQVYFSYFRNLSSFAADFSPHCNLIVGNNGSGKTSILEAIYCLAYGKSFRANHPRLFMQHQSDYCQLDCRYLHAEIEHTLRYNYQPSQAATRLLNNDALESSTTVAKMMPTVFIDTGTHRCFAQAPKYRRDFFNWCCFYHSNRYQSAFMRYTRVLSQRNHYLKQARYLGQEGLEVWNEPLLYYADILHQDRTALCSLLESCLQNIWAHLAPKMPNVQLSYQPGWPQDKDLTQLLISAQAQDIQLGYTQFGPHRADIKICTQDKLCVYKYFSEGQQKLLSYALKLSQLHMLQMTNNQHPGLLLIDDLPAELDKHSRGTLLDYMCKQKSQFFITGLDANDFPENLAANIVSMA